MTERRLQSAVAGYLRAVLTAETFATAIPGGDGQMTTAPGYVSGTPDYLIVHNGKALFIGVGSLFAGYAAARGAGVRSDVALALGLAASEISVRAWSNASKKTQAAVAPPVARPTVPREPPRRFAS